MAERCIIIYNKQFLDPPNQQEMRQRMSKIKSDYSLEDQSKLIIRSFDYYGLDDEIKRIKYPTYSISNAEGLDAKIQSFKDQKIRTQLRQFLVDLNSYRKVRGDGNCFFRALAFCYLAQAVEPTVATCFAYLNEIRLTCCYPDSIPPDFKKFYDHNFLCRMLQRYWEPYFSNFLQQSDRNARKALIKVFDQYPFLDFIVVLYFRALCLKGLYKFEEQMKQFLLGKEQEYIRTYSEETEGVSINICSMFLKLTINVYEIRKGVVKVYHYDPLDKKRGEIHLLFYENHYDIIQKNEQIEAELNSLSKNAFYSDVSRKTVRGVCLECNSQKFVYQDSAICYSCFDKIEKVAKQYDTEKTRRGRCHDCYYIRQDVLEDIGICKKCIKAQNEAEDKRKAEEKRRAEREKQKNEKSQKDSKDEKNQKDKDKDEKSGKMSQKQQKPKSVYSYCLQCNYERDVDNQTGICSQCTQRQKIALMKDERRRESRQKYQLPMQETKQEKPISDGYDRFRIIQTKSPTKDRMIGRQIKPQHSEYTEESKVTEQQSKRTSSTIINSIGSKVKIEKCINCNQKDQIEDKTPLCKKCYRKLFCEYTLCTKCKYRSVVHEDTKKCKQCYFANYDQPKPTNDNKQRASSSKNYCIKCHDMKAKREGLCQGCFDKHFCISCKKVTWGSMLINRTCPSCRRRY